MRSNDSVQSLKQEVKDLKRTCVLWVIGGDCRGEWAGVGYVQVWAEMFGSRTLSDSNTMQGELGNIDTI